MGTPASTIGAWLLGGALREVFMKQAAPKRVDKLRWETGRPYKNASLKRCSLLITEEALDELADAGVLHVLQRMMQDGEFLEGRRD
jgi:hypothetical protein